MLSVFKQFCFANVPGYDTASHPACVFIDEFLFSYFDAYIFVVRGKLRGADEADFKAIALSGKPVCIARSFAESCNDEDRAAISGDLQSRLALDADHHIGFFSNRTREGTAAIFNAIAASQCDCVLTLPCLVRFSLLTPN